MVILLAWLPLILIPLLSQFLLAPIVVRFKQTHPASPEFEPVNVGQLPLHVAEGFKRFIHTMQADGFMFAGYFRQLAYMRGTGFYMALLKNAATGDMGYIIFLFTKGGLVSLTTSHVEFFTRFSDGTEVETNNAQYFGTFRAYPEKKVNRFPDLHDPRLLFRLHRRLCADSVPGVEALMPADGQEAFQLSYGTVKEVRKQAEFGYYRLDEKAQVFRLTWKGAFLMTWKLAWPVGALRKAGMRSMARQTVRSLGF